MRMLHTLTVVSLCFASAAPALAQDVFTPPDSVVYGRQVLMDEIEAQMGPVDSAAIGDPFDLSAARRGASAVSAMLTATPYLFPAGTDLAATAADDFPSLARPDVWRDFAAFTAMANQASQMAFDLTQVTDEAQFRTQGAALRAVCNACHAAYMQVDETPF